MLLLLSGRSTRTRRPGSTTRVTAWLTIRPTRPIERHSTKWRHWRMVLGRSITPNPAANAIRIRHQAAPAKFRSAHGAIVGSSPAYSIDARWAIRNFARRHLAPPWRSQAGDRSLLEVEPQRSGSHHRIPAFVVSVSETER